jgi:hypothetical protein
MAESVAHPAETVVPGKDRMKFLDACRVVVANGYTPVSTKGYERLRAWCDANGWPPKDWQPLPCHDHEPWEDGRCLWCREPLGIDGTSDALSDA